MVILVPFLLITAVFSHMSILDLNLPPKQANNPQNDDKKKERNFEVIIRKDKLVLADTLGGVIKSFPKEKGEYNMRGLSKLLVEVKKKFPDKKNITILLEPNIPYEALVHAMDTVRVVEDVEMTSVVKKELFPQVAIGDAPPEGS